VNDIRGFLFVLRLSIDDTRFFHFVRHVRCPMPIHGYNVTRVKQYGLRPRPPCSTMCNDSTTRQTTQNTLSLVAGCATVL
jgi:hypothetical protein